MKLLLMRHGEAVVKAASDAERALSDRGMEEVRIAANLLGSTTSRIDKVMVSPYIRARQTAEILCSTLGIAPEQLVSDAITPEAVPAEACAALAKCFSATDTGLAVMHQPIISRLVYYLSGTDQPMGTASIAVLDAPDLSAGCCELECVI